MSNLAFVGTLLIIFPFYNHVIKNTIYLNLQFKLFKTKNKNLPNPLSGSNYVYF